MKKVPILKYRVSVLKDEQRTETSHQIVVALESEPDKYQIDLIW